MLAHFLPEGLTTNRLSSAGRFVTPFATIGVLTAVLVCEIEHVARWSWH
jgi:hypothetical protein